MSVVTLGPYPLKRYYQLTVSSTPVAIDPDYLVDANGRQVRRAIGRVSTATVRLGVLGMLTPTAAKGLPFEDDDVIVLDGADNVAKALFIATGSNATIDWMLETDGR